MPSAAVPIEPLLLSGSLEPANMALWAIKAPLFNKDYPSQVGENGKRPQSGDQGLGKVGSDPRVGNSLGSPEPASKCCLQAKAAPVPRGRPAHCQLYALRGLQLEELAP